MEIQYAFFCEGVKFPDKPKGKITIIQPISAPTFKGVTSFQMNMPLFVTFINGDARSGHNLDVKAIDSSGNIIGLKEFKFRWQGTSPVQVARFMLELPKIDHSDILTFSFILDGEPQKEIKIPFRIMR